MLLSPEAVPRVDTARWSQQAATFLAAQVALRETLTDPAGVLPERAAMVFSVQPARGGAVTWVRVATRPLSDAPEALAAAERGVAAIGGAGFDALVARARRVWEVGVRPVEGDDARAPLVMAALLALVLLAPVVPPEGGTIFGVRGCRVRLEAAGWPERALPGT